MPLRSRCARPAQGLRRLPDCRAGRWLALPRGSAPSLRRLPGKWSIGDEGAGTGWGGGVGDAEGAVGDGGLHGEEVGVDDVALAFGLHPGDDDGLAEVAAGEGEEFLGLGRAEGDLELFVAGGLEDAGDVGEADGEGVEGGLLRGLGERRGQEEGEECG
jgi:hypothetical protein